MTNDPDLTHVFDITKGFCDTHGQTIFVCLKCQNAAATHESADSDGLALVQEVQRLRLQVADMQHELDARADILNRAVTAKQHKFPAELGNGWIDSIDRLDQGIVDLRREKSKMRAALQMTIDMIEDKRNKVEMTAGLYGMLTSIVLEVNRVLDEV